ncbi:hypothetical protein DIS24_g11030 [Lasiodiplodia hormozganensis]|uniref:Uncharacterized protein n=1 Tax=Lasiodiplodia hormozganensis TaxID=869390 RepID=A0AA39X2J0_9PEZI|nr:hypothetical protein DIS24_g11030 [Lasiodiplodia hormozganensis]
MSKGSPKPTPAVASPVSIVAMALKEPEYKRYFSDPPPDSDNQVDRRTGHQRRIEHHERDVSCSAARCKASEGVPSGEASREDTIKPLRKALGRIRTKPWAKRRPPPEIDIFFPRPEEVQIDPGQSWIMVEEKGR